MLTENFIASTLSSGTASTSSTLKDVGIFLHELQPQCSLRHGYKKSSTKPGCLAISETHIFAAQSDKAVIHVYSREKGNQEALVPFPEKVHSLSYAGNGTALLIIGTGGGRLILWELASGRQVTSSASHLQAISSLVIDNTSNLILTGSSDSNVHVWSLPKLVSFSPEANFPNQNAPKRSPLRTFSSHRSAITAITCGHSRTNTNFAVSGSQDSTCYVWSLDACEILRTILLPASPLSFALDPADRAFYTGFENGTIHRVGLYEKFILENNKETPQAASAAKQLEWKDAWIPPASEVGRVNDLALSYDGTILLSGHEGGKILSWDIAKGRVQRAVADLGQPVTNVFFLQPDGLPTSRLSCSVKTVVKPRLEAPTKAAFSTSVVPSAYNLQLQLLSSQRSAVSSMAENRPSDDFAGCLTSSGFSRSKIDEALAALTAGQGSVEYSDPNKDLTLAKMERLEDEIVELNQKLQVYSAAPAVSETRRMARMEKRKDQGLKERNAHFEAKGRGENGNEGMNSWAQKEQEVDTLSCEEESSAEQCMDI